MAKKKSPENTVEIKAVAKTLVTVRIVGVSPLIPHQWADKARKEIRDKQQEGKKTKNREARNPEAEAEAATYFTRDGKYGLPVAAVKKAMISAAHKDLGIEKTLVKKAVFVYPAERDAVAELECSEPVMQEDCVRVGQGKADLRYRNYFMEWACVLTFELDLDLLQVKDFVNLLDRAGFGIGVLDWRPEKGGEYGRFKVDRKFNIQAVDNREKEAA